MIVDGISVIELQGAALEIDPKKNPKETRVETQLNNATKWANWGTDNLLPKRIVDEIEKDAVVFQSNEFNKSSHFGVGLNYYTEIRTKTGIEKDYSSISEVDDWMEANDVNSLFLEFITDFETLGNRVPSFVLDRGRNKIARMLRKDMAWCRWGKQDETSKKIEKLFYCADWETVGRNIPDEYKVLDVFDPIRSLEYFASKESFGNEFVFKNKTFTTNRFYYELANVEVLINSGNLEMKDKLKAAYKSLLDNSLGVAYHIEVTNEYCLRQINADEYKKWDTDASFRDIVLKKIKKTIDDWLTGVNNQGKSILTTKLRNKAGELESGVIITPLDDKIKQDKWLPSMQEYHNQSYNVMGVDPSNTGISNKNDGMNSGSEKKNAFFNQKATLGVDRLYTLIPFYTVARFNGWTKNYKGFKWEVLDEYPHLEQPANNNKPANNTPDANKK